MIPADSLVLGALPHVARTPTPSWAAVSAHTRGTHRDAGGWVPVPGQQREDVVLAVVAAARDERQVGRVGAAVGEARRLLGGVGEKEGMAVRVRGTGKCARGQQPAREQSPAGTAPFISWLQLLQLPGRPSMGAFAVLSLGRSEVCA